MNFLVGVGTDSFFFRRNWKLMYHTPARWSLCVRNEFVTTKLRNRIGAREGENGIIREGGSLIPSRNELKAVRRLLARLPISFFSFCSVHVGRLVIFVALIACYNYTTQKANGNVFDDVNWILFVEIIWMKDENWWVVLILKDTRSLKFDSKQGSFFIKNNFMKESGPVAGDFKEVYKFRNNAP